jgi:hypothetical protein
MEKEEVLQVFRKYVSGMVRMNDLEDWILSHIQGILNSGNQEAIALIDEVDALLIEIGAGISSEQDLFDTISRFISDAETVKIDLVLKASDINIISFEKSTDDDITAQQEEFDFSPQFV